MKVRSAQQKWMKIDEEDGVGLYRKMDDPTLYQLRLRNSERFVRKQFRALSAKRALLKIPEIMGTGKSSHEPTICDLADAFSWTLKSASRRPRAQRDWHYSVDRFMNWLNAHHPQTTHWGVLTRQILREYLDTYEGKSANTRRRALQPIIQTAGFMRREFGFSNIAERFSIGSKLKTTPQPVYLDDVVAFCDWMAKNNPRLEVGAALQGLAGLQLQEALRLTWDRVDLEKGLLEITGEVKNEYRKRVIPVANRVLLALKRANRRKSEPSGQVVLLKEPVVATVAGEPYQDPTSYSRQMRKSLLAWNPRMEWAPKDLRNCLPTFGISEGLWSAVWEQYIGHAPGTVTTRHYVPRLASVTCGEVSALQRQMNLFRLHVVRPLEQAIAAISKGVDVQPMYNDAQETNGRTVHEAHASP